MCESIAFLCRESRAKRLVLAFLTDATDGELLTTDFVLEFGLGVNGFLTEDTGVATDVSHTVNLESGPDEVFQSGGFLSWDCHKGD